jgi:hypothetical protein
MNKKNNLLLFHILQPKNGKNTFDQYYWVFKYRIQINVSENRRGNQERTGPRQSKHNTEN